MYFWYQCIHWYKEQNSTEGCSKLKSSVDMTSSGKNGLNIRTNASPRQDQMSGGVSVLCWLATPVAMFYGNLQIRKWCRAYFVYFCVHIGIYPYDTNSTETHKFCVCFQHANARSGIILSRVWMFKVDTGLVRPFAICTIWIYFNIQIHTIYPISKNLYILEFMPMYDGSTCMHKGI